MNEFGKSYELGLYDGQDGINYDMTQEIGLKEDN